MLNLELSPKLRQKIIPLEHSLSEEDQVKNEMQFLQPLAYKPTITWIINYKRFSVTSDLIERKENTS